MSEEREIVEQTGTILIQKTHALLPALRKILYQKYVLY
jgi:hypothetical protein